MGSSDWHKGVRACAQAFGGVRHPRKAESDVLEPMQNYFHRVIYNLCTGSPGYASDDESDDAHIPASPRTVRKVKFRAAASVPLSQSLMRRWGRPAGPLPNNQCRPRDSCRAQGLPLAIHTSTLRDGISCRLCAVSKDREPVLEGVRGLKIEQGSLET